MQKKRGDSDVARRLKIARVSAGFHSGRAAAGAFSWSPNTYKAYEGGQRALPNGELIAYARAFGVDPEWLASGEGSPPAMTDGFSADAAHDDLGSSQPHEAETDRQTHMLFAARRLGVARRMAAFVTASEACRHFKFVRSTYGGHEYGDEPLPRSWADIYGTAFGVDPGWLLTGAEPSRLPSEVAQAVREAEAGASEVRAPSGETYRTWHSMGVEAMLTRRSDPGRRGDMMTVATMVRAQRLARANDALAGKDMIVVEASGDTRPSRRETWGIPRAFLAHCGSGDATDLVMIPATDLDASAGPADRVVLELGPPSPEHCIALTIDGNGDVRLHRPASGPADDAPRTTGRVLAIVRAIR